MACLENVKIEQMVFDLDSREWVTAKEAKPRAMPHIFFDDGEPWVAANEYALERIQTARGNNPKTIVSLMGHLKAYACWLENTDTDWLSFPKKKKDRCLFRYRGFLIEQRDAGLLSSSTVSTRMNAVIRFYRWAKGTGWIDRKELWGDRVKVISFETSVGFQRTMAVTSTELSIPNRKRMRSVLEDGLLPITLENRRILLSFLHEHQMVELYLMTLIGCFTGARSETIRTLRVSSIENAFEAEISPSVKYISVGPGTRVKTKFDVSGQILFPTQLVNELERYAYSVRRLVRQSRAADEDKSLLFLTVRGNQYSDTTFAKLVSDLRVQMIAAGLSQFKSFIFHQTRATFGTQLMTFAINTLKSQADAIAFVRDAMLHKHESTTWKYINFIEQEPIREKLSEEFFNVFTGKTSEQVSQDLINQVVYEDIA